MKMSRLFRASLEDVSKLAGTSHPSLRALVEAGIVKADVAGEGDGKYRYYVFTMEQAKEAKRIVADYQERFGRQYLGKALTEAQAKAALTETGSPDALATLHATVARLEREVEARTTDLTELAKRVRWQEALVCKLYADLGATMPVRDHAA